MGSRPVTFHDTATRTDEPADADGTERDAVRRDDAPAVPDITPQRRTGDPGVWVVCGPVYPDGRSEHGRVYSTV